MRFMHCPQHELTQVEHNAHSVNALKPDSVGFSELDAGRMSGVPVLRRILSQYHVCSAAPAAGHEQEVPVALRIRGILPRIQNHVTDCFSRRISPDLGPGIENDRHYTVLKFTRRFSRRGRAWTGAHLVTHTNAAIQSKTTGAPLRNARTAVTQHAMQEIEAAIWSLIMEGREVVVTGDFNYRTYHTKNFRYWRYSPQRMFQRLNMNFHEEGLDYVAWTAGLHLTRPVRVIPTTSPLNGSDHPWLVAELRKK
jgi:hypothetical protein